MDQINIIDDSLHNLTQMNAVLLCDDKNVRSKVTRTVVNELFHESKIDDVMDYVVAEMTKVLKEGPHVSGCKSCEARASSLVKLIKNAVKENLTGGYYVYCVMEDVFPAFRYEPHNAPVSTLNFKRYDVRVRRFAMVTEVDSAQDNLATLAGKLPGVAAKVKVPCECSWAYSKNKIMGGESVMEAVIHLNDEHQWTREAIADWLDSVDDPENGVDLAFKVPEKEEV